jgi:hypothetical protein
VTNFRSKGQLADYIYVFWGQGRMNGLFIDQSTASKVANHVWPQLPKWPRSASDVPENGLYGQEWLNRCIEHVMDVMDQEQAENTQAKANVLSRRRRP